MSMIVDDGKPKSKLRQARGRRRTPRLFGARRSPANQTHQEIDTGSVPGVSVSVLGVVHDPAASPRNWARDLRPANDNRRSSGTPTDARSQ